MTIVLWNIRSAWNVGSIMRSCDAVGADLILVGYTPIPEGSTLKAVIKTSIGAEKNVKWRSFPHYQDVLQYLPNFQHWGIEINQSSQDILSFLDEQKAKNTPVSWDNTCLWFGNEITGLTEEVSQHLSGQLHLPMKGKKESLNVSNTVTSAAYLWMWGSKAG